MNDKKTKSILRDKFRGYGLDDDDVEVIHGIFKAHIGIVRKKSGRLKDAQVKSIVDTVAYSVRNTLNLIRTDVTSAGEFN